MILDIKKYCTENNASIGVNQALKDANDGDTILFSKGEYHFYKDYSQKRVYHMTNTDSFKAPTKYFGILIEDKNNIIIDGGGSVFVMHGDICAVSLVRCKNITLKNFTIRYNSPTNIEFTVLKKARNKITYSLAKNTEFKIEGKDIIFYESSPFTKKPYYRIVNDSKSYCDVIHRGDTVFRTSLSPLKKAVSIKRIDGRTVECSYIIPPKFSVGDVVAMSQNQLRDSSGLFFWECSNIKSENITVNYMHGFGWLSQMCENLSFDNIKFTPMKDYHVSSFADCIHVCGCKGYVNINNCLFSHPHDDGINIHGTFLRLKKIIDEHTAIFEFVHNQQGGYKAFFPGDCVKFYKMENLYEYDSVLTVKETYDDIDNKEVTIVFNEKLLPLREKKTVCENVTYNPRVTIKNCIFKAIPTRGILCTTDKESEICNNTFVSLKMPDIYISCDCKEWFESGPCKNLTIHNNTFSRQNSVVFEPLCLHKPVQAVHENILIYGNKVG
ncbi:MAG: hypothetical protein LIO62_08225 [Clostridiales bacterium]|nr:hypothetical protein [Clostridiales bacterium]